MVHGRARVHGDEDGVGQVGEDDDESSRRPVRRARANDSKASRLGGRSDTRRHRQFDQFALKTGESVTSCSDVREGLTGPVGFVNPGCGYSSWKSIKCRKKLHKR